MIDVEATRAAPPPPPPEAPPAMLPGVYLAKRREAAGVPLDVAARALGLVYGNPSASASGAADYRNQLQLLERDELATLGKDATADLLAALPRVFRFDPNVWLALLAARTNPDLPVPLICRNCACTWNDACSDSGGETCGWVNTAVGEPALCTMCIGAEGPDGGEELRHAA